MVLLPSQALFVFSIPQWCVHCTGPTSFIFNNSPALDCTSYWTEVHNHAISVKTVTLPFRWSSFSSFCGHLEHSLLPTPQLLWPLHPQLSWLLVIETFCNVLTHKSSEISDDSGWSLRRILRSAGLYFAIDQYDVNRQLIDISNTRT